MEVKLVGPKTITLQSSQVAYILDVLTTRPYKDVKSLIDDIFIQLKQQETNDEGFSNSASGSSGDGLRGFGPAD